MTESMITSNEFRGFANNNPVYKAAADRLRTLREAAENPEGAWSLRNDRRPPILSDTEERG